MSPLEVVAILLAGVAAGTINTVVGSGTLITFPTLLAFGIPPVTANVSNTIGLVPGSLSGAIGYRADYRWVDVGVFAGNGRPTHTRGVTSVPGLSFLGLPWLHTWGSGRFSGVARDALYLADRIEGRQAAVAADPAFAMADNQDLITT